MHIDDLIISDEDLAKVRKSFNRIVKKLEIALWSLDREKLVVAPVRSVEYLRAFWDSNGLEHTQATSSLIGMAIA